ncbi:putative membrane protein [Altererythrobacter atlanticus]|uniref:Uncharacterized protein n=1 Tax=Croceibacterium atlanticum TaxID=1267766 RepID=A0A0F7KV33_9SPHN|nr:DUF202 domain-containing protein [Croceibacterium atlanticum]AKH43499.1 hypothetical protein WYH_02469 [Croceibacterium atlanticum]MBB5731793.1 putative membrane protein [Croceibacterium atlanticum]
MSEGKDKPDRSTRLAEDRTDWAEDRTILAVERTFAGWMRTAFGAIGIGLAFNALFGELDPPWLARAIATLFLLLGAGVALTAQHRARKSFEKLDCHAVDTVSAPNIRWIAWIVAIGSVLLVAGLWVLNDGRIGG